MKYLSSRFGYLFAVGETRANLAALLKYFAFLALLITVFAVIFHVIMIRFEGQQHSWITGFYWTLVVMTTLGSATSPSPATSAVCSVSWC